MCSRGRSKLLWPGRSGAIRTDYISYGTRSGPTYRYSRPPPLPGVYYGSRYHPASSFSGPDPWTPPPRVRSFADSYNYSCRDHSSAYFGQGLSESYNGAAGGSQSHRSHRSRHSKRHDAEPSSPRRKSHGKHVHFDDTVRCYHYRTEEPRQGGMRAEKCCCGRDDSYDHYDYDRRQSRRQRRSRRDQSDSKSKSDRRPRDSYEEVYRRSPREAAAERNRTRYEEASQEDTRRRKRHCSSRRRSVEVEVDVRY